MASGVCELCLNIVDKFVDSHIIPRAFYEGIEKQGMLSVSDTSLGKQNTRRLKKDFMVGFCVTIVNNVLINMMNLPPIFLRKIAKPNS